MPDVHVKVVGPEQSAEEDLIINTSNTLTWLSKFPPERAVMSIGQGGPKLTAAELILEIENKTELGAQVVALFVQTRDGTRT